MSSKKLFYKLKNYHPSTGKLRRLESKLAKIERLLQAAITAKQPKQIAEREFQKRKLIAEISETRQKTYTHKELTTIRINKMLEYYEKSDI